MKKCIISIFSVILFPIFALAQGVRDRCPIGDCLSYDGTAALWFWSIVGILIVVHLFTRFFESPYGRKEVGLWVARALKAITFLFGPAIIGFFIFGGRAGDGGEAAVFAFFAMLLIFTFTVGPAEWVFGEDDKDQEPAETQYRLGVMYKNGREVAQSDAEAVEWFRKAAEQGHAKALYNLGVIYDKGRGVEQNHLQAHMWFILAAAQGQVEAEQMRDLMNAQATPSQTADAQKLAAEWLAKHTTE